MVGTIRVDAKWLLSKGVVVKKTTLSPKHISIVRHRLRKIQGAAETIIEQMG